MAPLQDFRSVNTLSGLLLTCPTKDQQVHETPADSFGLTTPGYVGQASKAAHYPTQARKHVAPRQNRAREQECVARGSLPSPYRQAVKSVRFIWLMGFIDPSTISQIPSIKGHKGSIRGYLGVLVHRL